MADWERRARGFLTQAIAVGGRVSAANHGRQAPGPAVEARIIITRH